MTPLKSWVNYIDYNNNKKTNYILLIKSFLKWVYNLSFLTTIWNANTLNFPGS